MCAFEPSSVADPGPEPITHRTGSSSNNLRHSFQISCLPDRLPGSRGSERVSCRASVWLTSMPNLLTMTPDPSKRRTDRPPATASVLGRRMKYAASRNIIAAMPARLPVRKTPPRLMSRHITTSARLCRVCNARYRAASMIICRAVYAWLYPMAPTSGRWVFAR